MTEIVHCEACNMAFVWRTHVRTGKPAPICYEPAVNLGDMPGNVVIEEDGRYRVLTKNDKRVEPLYLNHFANCPQRHRFALQCAPTLAKWDPPEHEITGSNIIPFPKDRVIKGIRIVHHTNRDNLDP